MRKVNMPLYNVSYRFAMFLHKRRWLYYILAHTWGIILTLIGYIIALALLITGHKPHRYHGTFYFYVGKLWGGFEMGTMFVRDKNSTEAVSMHELGHTYQNCLFGPFQIILVAIPSMTRYWYRTIREKRGKVNTTDYDDVWFEASATDIGTTIVPEERNGSKSFRKERQNRN